MSPNWFSSDLLIRQMEIDLINVNSIKPNIFIGKAFETVENLTLSLIHTELLNIEIFNGLLNLKMLTLNIVGFRFIGSNNSKPFNEFSGVNDTATAHISTKFDDDNLTTLNFYFYLHQNLWMCNCYMNILYFLRINEKHQQFYDTVKCYDFNNKYIEKLELCKNITSSLNNQAKKQLDSPSFFLLAETEDDVTNPATSTTPTTEDTTTTVELQTNTISSTLETTTDGTTDDDVPTTPSSGISLYFCNFSISFILINSITILYCKIL